MNKINAATKEARFEIHQLKGWSKADLQQLSTSSVITRMNERVASFRTTNNIKSEMYPAEKGLILQVIAEMAEDTIMKISDVHQHLLNHGKCWFTKDGMLTGANVIQASAWLIPANLESKKPAAPFVMGMALAMTNVSSEGVMTPKPDFSPLIPLKLEEVNVVGMTVAAPLISTIMEDKVKEMGKVQGGRDLVDRLNDVITHLPKEDYLLLHYILCCGPFSHHFAWAKIVKTMMKEGTKTYASIKLTPLRSRTPGYRQDEVILGIKSQYASHYTDMSECATVAEMKRAGQNIHKMYLWSKGFVPKFQVPAITEQTFPVVYKFMNDCRTFRGTDDQGLSGWSCGFGGCGNPTKIQARLQRKLTVIMGAMSDPTKRGPVVVNDELENEMPMLLSQIKLWSANTKILTREIFFRTSSTSSRINGLLKENRYNSQSMVGSTEIFFPEPTVTPTKASEWSKTDMQSQMTRDDVFPEPVKLLKIQELSSHRIYGTLIQSKEWFMRKDLAVYALGSVHNMYGYVSNEPMYCMSADGSTEFDIARVEMKKIDMTEFLSAVCAHNGHRNGYFLDPRYYFSPKLNMLRHIKGKVFDFNASTVTDIIGTEIESNDAGVYAEEDSESADADQLFEENYSSTEDSAEEVDIEGEKVGEVWVPDQPVDDSVVYHGDNSSNVPIIPEEVPLITDQPLLKKKKKKGAAFKANKLLNADEYVTTKVTTGDNTY